jgi:D-glycero-alpha-D-manno-heptose-7-phosphate kinase
MTHELRKRLGKEPIETSVPCRVDMGGTLDLATFYNPLRHQLPCTFNIAINLRTKIRLQPYRTGFVKISSRGFQDAEYPANRAPFNHPLGLMFAVATYFKADGVHIDINSASPPRSALGGSSAAAVALVAAFLAVRQKTPLTAGTRKKIALLAHAIEESVASVPCGRQDQLAAAFGGVNAWLWRPDLNGPGFKRKSLFRKRYLTKFERHLLVAYGGVPHESKNINGQWVQQFISGQKRDLWQEILQCTKMFIDAVGRKNYKDAAAAMNTETDHRRKMTPEVLDAMGEKLVDTAVEINCGARFTGAGGGGCIWALGAVDDIDRLKPLWQRLLAERREARLLDTGIDSAGLILHTNSLA